MNLTPIQIISIVIAVLSALSASAANLTEIVGPHEAKVVVSASTLLTTILGSIMAIIGSQTSQINAVKAMTGVDTITVNKNAGAALAAMALDPNEAKVDMAPGAAAAVTKTAKDAQP